MKENQTIVESRDVVWMNKSFHKYFNTKKAFNKCVIEEQDTNEKSDLGTLASRINLNETREESEKEEIDVGEPSETPPPSRKRRRSNSEEEQYGLVAAVILDPEEPKTFNQAWFSDPK
jgi:hypothetical protein